MEKRFAFGKKIFFGSIILSIFIYFIIGVIGYFRSKYTWQSIGAPESGIHTILDVDFGRVVWVESSNEKYFYYLDEWTQSDEFSGDYFGGIEITSYDNCLSIYEISDDIPPLPHNGLQCVEYKGEYRHVHYALLEDGNIWFYEINQAEVDTIIALVLTSIIIMPFFGAIIGGIITAVYYIVLISYEFIKILILMVVETIKPSK